jgi:hypothetical protein
METFYIIGKANTVMMDGVRGRTQSEHNMYTFEKAKEEASRRAARDNETWIVYQARYAIEPIANVKITPLVDMVSI